MDTSDGQREDISRGLLTLTSDMLDERLAGGAEEGAAEREVLEELGAPATVPDGHPGGMLGQAIGEAVVALCIAFGAVTGFVAVFERVVSPRDRGHAGRSAEHRWSVEDLDLEVVNLNCVTGASPVGLMGSLGQLRNCTAGHKVAVS